MGISGLLPLLRSIQKTRHIRDFKGQTLGVDAYVWLHRGIISCATELALGKPTKKYIQYAMRQVDMLRHFGVTPFLVFDGDYLPSKAGTEIDRERKREESRKAGLELLSMGKTSLAHMELQKSIDITPTMALELIEACRGIGVQCLVAPYEADAQLYYLEKKGVISGIISEDSDLLVFGCKSLITKLDKYGECITINRDDFGQCKEVSLAGWTDKEFRYMAILSGCDYLDNIPRMGLKTAHRVVRRHKEIERIVKALQYDGGYSIPDGYIEAFKRANITFLHQRVFCPETRKMVMCNEPEDALTDEDLIYIGAELDEEIAQKISEGKLHPNTKKPIDLPTAVTAAKQTPDRKTVKQPPKTCSVTTGASRTSITNFFKPQATPVKPAKTSASSAISSSPVRRTPVSSIPSKRPMPSSAQITVFKMARKIDDKVFEACPETSRFFSSKSESKRKSLPALPKSGKLFLKLDDSESNKENIDPKNPEGGSLSRNYPLEAFRHKFLIDGLKGSDLNRRRSMPAMGDRRQTQKTPTSSLRSLKSYSSFDSASQTLDSLITKSSPESSDTSSASSTEWPEFVATGRKVAAASADPFARARSFR